MSEKRGEILRGVQNEVAYNDWTFYAGDSGLVDEGAIVDLVMRHVDSLLAEIEGGEAWLVNYGGYIHGVFSSEDKANEYTARRWVKAPSNWKIERWTMDAGAFDPADEEVEE